MIFLLDGMDLSRERPRSTGGLSAQDLSSHAQVIGRVPLHSGSARVDEHVGDAEDRAPVIEQRLCDHVHRPPGDNGESAGNLRDRPVVAMDLERGDGNTPGRCGSRRLWAWRMIEVWKVRRLRAPSS